MICFKTVNHIRYFFVRLRRWTKIPVFSIYEKDALDTDWYACIKDCEYIKSLDEKPLSQNKFWIIRSCDGRKETYYEGFSVKGRPSYSRDVKDAEFFLDDIAAEENLENARDSKHKKVDVRMVHLDLINELPNKRFIIICENKTNGNLSFFKAFVKDSFKLVTSECSDKAKRIGFRQCINTINELRATCKTHKYSMLPSEAFDINVRSKDIISFLRRTRPKTKLILSFNFKK